MARNGAHMNYLLKHVRGGQLSKALTVRAADGRAFGSMRTTALSLVLALALGIVGLFGAAPTTALAAVADTAPAHEKVVTANDDGTYDVALSVTGASESSTTRKPVDVVLVVDISNSMNDDSGTQRKSRWDISKAAMKSLADSLLASNEDGQVRVSVITFAGEVHQTGSTGRWASSSDQLKSQIDSIRLSTGYENWAGTNWSDALETASEMQIRDGAEKYVVFLSDGEPNKGGYTKPGSGFWPEYVSDYDAALEQAQSLDCDGFYSVNLTTGRGAAEKMQGVANAIPGGNGSYYLGTDEDKLNDSFAEIIKGITKSATYADVTIADKLSGWVQGEGTNGVPSNFTYTKTASGATTPWNDAPAATVDDNGVVSWKPMGENKLEDGVTYTVHFTVTPTQNAFDKAVEYVGKDSDGPDTSDDNQTGFFTNDNEAAKVIYHVVTTTDGVESVGEKQDSPYNKPVITVPTSMLTITKQWSDAENVDHSNDAVTVDVTDSANKFSKSDVTLNKENNWSVEIPVAAGPAGHTYTVIEDAVEGYTATFEVNQAESTDGALSLYGLKAMTGTVTITNSPSTGAVSLAKTVAAAEGIEASEIPSKTFTFTVTIKDKDGAELVYQPFGLVGADGIETAIVSGGTVNLAADQTAMLSGLPIGATVTFVETPVDGFTSDAQNNAKTSEAVEAGTTKTVAFTNTYNGFELRIFKYTPDEDSDKTPLDGAKFELAKQGSNAKAMTVTTDENGNASFVRLTDGTYTLSETEAPAGYAIHDPMTFEVVNGVAKLDGIEVKGAEDFYGYRIEVENAKAVTSLPKTGGMGNAPLFVGGMIAIAGATALLTKRSSK